MKKIFLVIVILFWAVFNIQAQTKTISKDSISGGAVFTKAEIDTQLATINSRQNLMTDTSQKNKLKRNYFKVIVQYVVSKIRDSSFIKVEVNTTFPEDAERWKKYLIKNLNAITPCKNKAKAGTYQVIVRFIESKDSYTSDINALTIAGYGMEEEVVQLIKKSQRFKWIPAEQNGNTIKTYRK